MDYVIRLSDCHPSGARFHITATDEVLAAGEKVTQSNDNLARGLGGAHAGRKQSAMHDMDNG